MNDFHLTCLICIAILKAEMDLSSRGGAETQSFFDLFFSAPLREIGFCFFGLRLRCSVLLPVIFLFFRNDFILLTTKHTKSHEIK